MNKKTNGIKNNMNKKTKKCKHYWKCSASTFCQSHSHKCNLCGQIAKEGEINHANIDGK